jgi:hypothetical protein
MEIQFNNNINKSLIEAYTLARKIGICKTIKISNNVEVKIEIYTSHYVNQSKYNISIMTFIVVRDNETTVLYLGYYNNTIECNQPNYIVSDDIMNALRLELI